MKNFYKLLIGMCFGLGIGILRVPIIMRIMVTFNSFFGEILKFSVPLIILAFVSASIIEIGAKSKKIFGWVVMMAYTASVVVGIISFLVVYNIFPEMLASFNGIDFGTNNLALTPFVKIGISPFFSGTSALLFSFILGIGTISIKNSRLSEIIKEFKLVIYNFILSFIIPLLPFYVAGAFARMTYSTQAIDLLFAVPKVLLVSYGLQLATIFVYFLIAGIIYKTNPFSLLYKMLPSYVTALGTGSSTATMPVTLQNMKKMGVKPEIAEFMTPLCSNIHMPGSMIHIISYAVAIMVIFGQTIALSSMVPFVLMLGIMCVAAPGIPGGIIITSVVVLESFFGFNDEMVALLIALPTFGSSTGCNVVTDGALSLWVEKIFFPKDDITTIPTKELHNF